MTRVSDAPSYPPPESLRATYDRRSDTLFVGPGEPVRAFNLDMGGVMWARYLRGQHAVAGIEIEDFKARFVHDYPQLADYRRGGFISDLIALARELFPADVRRGEPLPQRTQRSAAESQTDWQPRRIPLDFLARFAARARASFVPIAWPATLAAGGAQATQLDAAIPGVRVELRWPQPGVRSLVQLVIVVVDWAALGHDATQPLRYALQAPPPPPEGIPWADWLADGVWEDSIEPNARDSEIPLTQALQSEFTLVQQQHLREWLQSTLLLALPIDPPADA